MWTLLIFVKNCKHLISSVCVQGSDKLIAYIANLDNLYQSVLSAFLDSGVEDR